MTAGRISQSSAPRTVPYEGGDYTNSKMDNFSLICKTSCKFFYVNAKQEVYLKVKNSFLKLKNHFRKA